MFNAHVELWPSAHEQNCKFARNKKSKKENEKNEQKKMCNRLEQCHAAWPGAAEKLERNRCLWQRSRRHQQTRTSALYAHLMRPDASKLATAERAAAA